MLTDHLHAIFLYLIVGLISVPAGRFVAAATLALRFRTEQSFLGAFDEPLGPTRCWSRRRYHRMWCS